MDKQTKPYKIEVSITQGSTASVKKPYYWILWGFCDKEWINECCGWAETPPLAWEDAYKFYKAFKSPVS